MMQTFPATKPINFGRIPKKLFHFFKFLSFQELERQKHTCTVLQHKQEELKEGMRQRDELIEVNRTALALRGEQHFPPTTSDGVSWLRLEAAAAAPVHRPQPRPSLC